MDRFQLSLSLDHQRCSKIGTHAEVEMPRCVASSNTLRTETNVAFYNLIVIE